MSSLTTHVAMDYKRDDIERMETDGVMLYAEPVKSNMELLHEYLSSEPRDGLIGFQDYLKLRGIKLMD